MDRKNCEYCYYEGIKKCFLHDKEFEEIKKCNEYLLDPYLYNSGSEESKQTEKLTVTVN